MSPPVRPRLRQRYTLEDVRRAIDSIKHEGAAISVAARKFNIPKSTLHDKLNGRCKEDVPMGRPSTLRKEEEDIIVQWILNIAEAGFRITKDQLTDSVSCLVKELKRPNPFKDNVPGESWYQLFLGRHPIISQHVSQASSRAQITKEQLQEWFQKMKTYLLGKGLLTVLNDPRRVFTADESAFYLSPIGNKVLIRKCEKKTKCDEEECVTVLVNANAAGELAPPMVVFDDERIPDEIISRFPDEWGIGKSTTGWMTRETFYEYVTYVFHPWLKSAKIKLPVLLFIDGHYLSKYLSDFCFANGIEIIALYPNSKYLLHPLDVAVFRPLKMDWKKTADQWEYANDGRQMTKEEFSPILQTVLQKLDSKVIVDSFKAIGFDKLNLDDVHLNGLIMKKQVHSPGIISMENKLSELRSHLGFLETKIGLEKVRRFAVKVVPTRDESLYEIWKSIKEEVITLGEQIASKKQHLIPSEESTNVPQTTNTTLETTDNIDDPDEDLTILRPTEGGEDDKEQSNEQEEGRVLAVGNETFNESVLRTLFNDPSYTNCNGGMSIEIIVPDDVNDHRLPGEVTWISSTNTQMSTSHPTSMSSGTIIRSLTPQQSSEPTSTNAVTYSQSLSPQQSPISSSFKRCLPYSSPTSIKKKLKSKNKTLVTGESYKLNLKNKEEKKNKEKNRRRLIKERKKENDNKPVIRKLIIIEDESSHSSSEDDDEPSPVEPEDLSVNSWVVVLYLVRGKKKPFVGQIKTIKRTSASVRFLVGKGNKFVWPQEDDIDDEVPFSEIVQILKAPLLENRGHFSFKEKIIFSQH